MIKVFVANGYNSYTNKQLKRAFLAPSEAEQFLVGLTDPKVNILTAKSYIDLINDFIGGKTK
jgi:hypothetical protein